MRFRIFFHELLGLDKFGLDEIATWLGYQNIKEAMDENPLIIGESSLLNTYRLALDGQTPGRTPASHRLSEEQYRGRVHGGGCWTWQQDAGAWHAARTTFVTEFTQSLTEPQVFVSERVYWEWPAWSETDGNAKTREWDLERIEYDPAQDGVYTGYTADGTSISAMLHPHGGGAEVLIENHEGLPIDHYWGPAAMRALYQAQDLWSALEAWQAACKAAQTTGNEQETSR